MYDDSPIILLNSYIYKRDNIIPVTTYVKTATIVTAFLTILYFPSLLSKKKKKVTEKPVQNCKNPSVLETFPWHKLTDTADTFYC